MRSDGAPFRYVRHSGEGDKSDPNVPDLTSQKPSSQTAPLKAVSTAKGPRRDTGNIELIPLYFRRRLPAARARNVTNFVLLIVTNLENK